MMTARRRPRTPFGRRLAGIAREAVPDDADLWPAIAWRLEQAQPGSLPRYGRALGLAGILAAAMIGALVLVKLFVPGNLGTHEQHPLVASPNIVPNGPGDLAILVPHTPAFSALGAGSLWVPVQGNGTLLRIDRETGATIAMIDLNVVPIDPWVAEQATIDTLLGRAITVIAADDAIWVGVPLLGDAGSLLQIDPATNSIVQRVDVEVDPYRLARDGDTLWVTAVDSDMVLRVDTRSGSVAATIQVAWPGSIAVGEGGIWVVSEFTTRTNRSEGQGIDVLSRIDPATNLVEQQVGLGVVTGVAVNDGALWVTNLERSNVERIDPTTLQVTDTIPASAPGAIVVAGGQLWVVDQLHGTVLQIDPTTHDIVATYSIDDATLTAGEDAVWVTSISSNLVVRIDLP